MGQPPPRPPVARPPSVARHVAAAIAAVQPKPAGNSPAGVGAGNRPVALHVAAATAAVQRKPTVLAGPRPAVHAPAPHVQAAVQPKSSGMGTPQVPSRARIPAPPLPAPPRSAVPPPEPRTPPRPRTPDTRRGAALQAKFPLDIHYGHVLDESTLRKLGAIQDLLADSRRVKMALQYLESQVQEYVEEAKERALESGNESDEMSVHHALNLALQDEELKWMNLGRIKVTSDSDIVLQNPKTTPGNSSVVATISSNSKKGPLPVGDFVEQALQPLMALKDVGAGLHHGEYAHRLQWYVIAYWFRLNFGADELRRLYLLMSSEKLVIQHPTEKKEEISLWDAVLDVRGAWATDKGQTGELYGGVKGVGFAVPGFLTGVLTDDDLYPNAKVLGSYETYLQKERWSEDLPYLSAAVTWRKLKRKQG